MILLMSLKTKYLICFLALTVQYLEIFNIDTLNNSAQISNFITEMSSRGFFNPIDHPTRVHLDDDSNTISSTSIDQIWTSCHNIVFLCIEFYISLPYRSYPIGCSIDLPSNNEKYLNKISKN